MCDIHLPPDCDGWNPQQIFHRRSPHCKEAQSRYIDECATGLDSYYLVMLGAIIVFLLVELLVLILVLIYLRRAQKRALVERSALPEMEESLAERVAMERGDSNLPENSRWKSGESGRGSSLVLPAYYWFLRFECMLCVLWICFYAVSVWIELDPKQRWTMTATSPTSRTPPDFTVQFILPKILVFACNALGTTLDASLLVYLSHQNAGHRIWKRSMTIGVILGAISGVMSVIPEMLPYQDSPQITHFSRLTGFANDSLIRLGILLVLCVPLACWCAYVMLYGEARQVGTRCAVVGDAGYYVAAMMHVVVVIINP
eukprot:jgi/Bigna1/81665/fgenesh1_pg.82_\